VQRAAGLAEPPPHDSDAAFRAALRDGVLLCRCANAVWPGLVPGVVESADRGPSGLTRQRLENVTSFLDALGGGGGGAGAGGSASASAPMLPADAAFSVADLEYEGADDRPRVVDCVLWMRAQHQAFIFQQQQQQQQRQVPGATATATATAATTPAPHNPRSVEAAAGVTRLMQQCTAMLRERMFHDAAAAAGGSPAAGGAAAAGVSPLPLQHHQTPLRSGAARLSTTPATAQQHHHRHASVTPSPGIGSQRPAIGSAIAARYGGSSTGAGVLAAAVAAAGGVGGGGGVGGVGGGASGPLSTPAPDPAIDAMGPILEGVLGSLTQEYERRLLSKDHELAAARDAVASLQRQAAALQAEADAARRNADARSDEAARLAHSGASEEAASLRLEVADLRNKLEHTEAQLRDLERRAGASAAAVREREEQLERELAALRVEAEAAADLTEKYRRAVADNRRLYNAVQDLKGSIRVFCRVRPLGATGDQGPGCLEPGAEDGELALWDVSAAARAGVGGSGGAAAAMAVPGAAQRKTFKLDRVFGPESTQADVYEDTAPLVRCVLDGYNVCIFAYGQTGSGKTHTMSGGGGFGGGGGGGGGGGEDEQECDQRGINYRALDDLFALQDARRGEIEYRITVQMLEIYNEQLRDLLVGAGGGSGESASGGNGGPNAAAPTQKLEILSTLASGCNVPGAVQVEVRTADDVARLMRRGARNRATGGTRMNERSSRSHQVVTVTVSGLELSTGARSHGCLHLVDLAGSERVARSEASGDRLVEAQHINRSLSALGDVMAALAQRGSGGGSSGGGAGDKTARGGNGGGLNHVPFRNSKLTHLLQDSLSGNAKVMMFVHVSPEASSSGESLSTLKFAARVSEITLGPARRNGESGRVFEAKEAALRAQRGEEARQHEAAALRAALEAEAVRVDELTAENERLRGLLAAERRAGAAAHVPSPSAGGGGAASGRRVSGGGGGGGGEYGLPPQAAAAAPPLPSARLVPRLSLGAAVVSDGGGGSTPPPPLRSARLGAERPSGIPSAGGSGGGSGGGLRPLSPGLSLTPPAHYLGGAGEGVVREASSSQRHIERLAAARARNSLGGGGGAGGNDGSLTARGGRPSASNNDGSLTARGGYAGSSGARASDVAMPMTARAHRTSGGGGGFGGGGAAAVAGGGVAGLRASVAGGLPRVAAASGGGGFGGGAPSAPSGSLTARGSSTARGGGGRWK
jgi:kinesin family protein C2/C3